MNENETITVTLTLDNDEELECAVLAVFETAGQKYAALLPLDENGEEAGGQVYLYRYIDSKDGDPDLENIIEDDEFERASDAFNKWMEEHEPETIDLDGLD
ncbi:MAG TPA: DUF1292 domain-containing protein [Candidatus Mediterraneibacter stercoravium]|uniref:DUF1292 domain-containing protein n=1 Tax=Candidatus Mediterraneibacter stercoravium TaxID=2838685 RepID=A0A9D2G8I6_9FIRM|nr:DUF1292 domain-containing protein [Candidatus Mediterraneibacter stercoravium]